MVSQSSVEAFLALPTLALAGASRGGRKFGNVALKDLRAKGYEVLPVHPTAGTVDGLVAAPSLAALAKPVAGLVLVVPPAQALRLVEEAGAVGIRNVWFQPGSESPDAVRACEALGLSAVVGECILMHAPPVRSIHRLHRWIHLWRARRRSTPAVTD